MGHLRRTTPTPQPLFGRITVTARNVPRPRWVRNPKQIDVDFMVDAIDDEACYEVKQFESLEAMD